MLSHIRNPIVLIVLALLLVALFTILRPKDVQPSTGEVFNKQEALAASKLVVTMPPKPEPPLTFVPSSRDMLENIPHATSTIATSSASGLPDCSGVHSADFECYQNLYTQIVKTKGIPAAFADLKARYDQNSYVKAQCHPLTHVIGRVAAQSFSTVSEAYKYGDSFCWSGYYHGVLETFVAKIGRENLTARIDSICADLNSKHDYNFNYFNCVHGVGHGLMAITDDELFQSLDYCSSMHGSWEQQSCAGGVYMENVIVDGLNHVTKYLNPKRPLYPCSDSPDMYKNTCYLMQTSYMLKINGGDFVKTFAWCRDAGSAYQAACLQSLGRDASGRSSSNAQMTYATCMLGGNFTEQSNCVIGAVKDFISYFHSDTQALVFCRLFTDAKLQSTCIDTASAYYKIF